MTGSTDTTGNRNDLEGKRILVTGGTQGIGGAIVTHLRRAGATVMTTARSVPADLEMPDLFIQADVSTPEGAVKIIQETLDRLGGIDVLVNVVGGPSSPPGDILGLSDEDWQRHFEENLFSAVRLDRGFLPAMLEQGSGVIIHISSVRRLLPLNASVPYAAAKAALTNYSKALANEVARHGIGVNSVVAVSLKQPPCSEPSTGSPASWASTRMRLGSSSLTRWEGFPWGVPVARKKSLNWSPSWCRTERPISAAVSILWMGETFGRSDPPPTDA